MTARYFLPDFPDTGVCQLDGSEAHHLLHVMRCQVGDQIELFDGQGRVATAAIIEAARKQVAVEVLQVSRTSQESAAPLHLGIALPKGDRQKWLIEKCVELGVASVTPLETSRSVAQPTEKALERLRRSVIEASKQCGRNHLMEIRSPVALARWWDDRGTGDAVDYWVAHPGESATPLAVAVAQRIERLKPADGLAVAIGPEGGFAESELSADWQKVSLGKRILRMETAALAIAAANLLAEQSLERAGLEAKKHDAH